MREDYASNLLAAMRRGELDAAITALPQYPQATTRPAQHRTRHRPDGARHQPRSALASHDRIPLTQLRDEPMVALVAFLLETLAVRHGH